MKVKYSGSEIRLHEGPIRNRVLKYSMVEDCKAVAAPLGAGLHLKSSDGNKFTEKTPYRQLVGELMYLANTVVQMSHLLSTIWHGLCIVHLLPFG